MPDVFPLVHEQHPWFMVALGGLFLLALVASRFARRWPEGLSRKLTLRLGLATVAAVVGWFIDPVLAAGVSSFFVPPFFDDLSLVRVAVLFLAEVIGIAVAGRLVLQVTEGRAFAMAAAMVLGNLLSGSYEEELPHAYLVLTFALPLMAAFLMSGWDRDFRFGRVVGEAHTTAASGEAGHRCISRKKPSGWVEWLGLSSAAALASSWGTYGVLITALSLSYEPSRYGWLVWLGLPGLLSVFLGT